LKSKITSERFEFNEYNFYYQIANEKLSFVRASACDLSFVWAFARISGLSGTTASGRLRQRKTQADARANDIETKSPDSL
jgi:hypothetical protein